ncbi:MAG: HD domain-containing protein [Candidatus Aenigmarchaeota archaeon]|nr:HD domain-containing protein [Candidatus Aenigmarchaeota archaeon]
MESLISDYVKKALSKKPDILTHTLRVVGYCKAIGRTEDADMDILISSAWLHDICWSKLDMSPENLAVHAEESAKLAKDVLNKMNMSDRMAEKIVSAISVHESLPDSPSIEAKILFEADHLDRIGAVGISKIFSSWGIKGGLDIINTKILPSMEEWFTTRKGFELAKEKIIFLNLFVDNYNKEIIEANKG